MKRLIIATALFMLMCSQGYSYNNKSGMSLQMGVRIDTSTGDVPANALTFGDEPLTFGDVYLTFGS